MVKDWADQCSSDEDDELDETESGVDVQLSIPVDQGLANNAVNEGNEETVDQPQPERVYDYPSQGPYTAFVGNLPFTVKNGDALVEELTKLVTEFLHTEMSFLSSRMILDRNSNRPKGFGYVEVATLDELKKLMELNNCDNVVVGGRRVQLDTSNGGNAGNNARRNTRDQRNGHGSRSSTGRSGGRDLDGSKFRDGKYTRKENDASESRDETGAPKERTRIVLKPRSKPTGAEEGIVKSDIPVPENGLGSSSSSIFGNAKARDEQSWQDRRNSEKSITSSSDILPNEQRKESMGGRGRGRSTNSGRGVGHRGSGRGESLRSEQQDPAPAVHVRPSNRAEEKKKKTENAKSIPIVAAAPVEATKQEQKTIPPKPTNAFASLALDSDSD